MYGDLSLEDVDEFENLESSDHFREVNPFGLFERNEFRRLDEGFELEQEEDEESPLDRFVSYDDRLLYDPEAPWEKIENDEEYSS